MIEKGSITFEMEGDLYRWKSKWWNTIDHSTEAWDTMYREGSALEEKYDKTPYIFGETHNFYKRCYDFIFGKEPEKYNGRVNSK